MEAVEERKVPKRTAKPQAEGARKPARKDAIVTARVPIEIRDQGNEVLKKIGSNPTELVNAAYAHVIRCGELPRTTPSLEDLSGKRRTLTPEQKKVVAERMRSMSLKAPADWGDRSFKELLAEARDERYARFS